VVENNMATVSAYDGAPYQKVFSSQVVALGEHGVALAQTLFYPTGGGQPGDSGQLTLPDGTKVRVSGTVRDHGVIWHQVEASPGLIQPGMEVQGNIDWARRYQHMKMHTCLHLLCAIMDAPVTGCSKCIPVCICCAPSWTPR
jgi:misacylated tRNA(Ala) deacylase